VLKNTPQRIGQLSALTIPEGGSLVPEKQVPDNHSGLRTYRADQLSALLWMGVGTLILRQSRELDYMAEYGPGPGFLPFWLGAGVIALGIALLAKATFWNEKSEKTELPTRHAATQLILVCAGIFGLALLASTVGFIICIGLLFFCLLFFVERRGWKFSLIMAIASPLALWLVFELGLDLRLPQGLLDLFR
jgi:putative tricarboxylic transport membrane protein